MDSDARSSDGHTTKLAPRRRLVCPRYENLLDYLSLVARPLTAVEQRAFLYMLDLDGEDNWYHAEDGDGTEHECICMEILPQIVQALEPDPVDPVIAQRSLDDCSYASQRFHTEKVGRFQGVVLNHRTQVEKTEDLRKRGNDLLRDFEKVLREVVRRQKLIGYKSRKDLIRGAFPRMVSMMTGVALTPTVAPKANTSSAHNTHVHSQMTLTWNGAHQRVEREKVEAERVVNGLKVVCLRWGIE